MVSAETHSGRVIGTRSGGASVFLGIPYAKPPIAELRWVPPEPLDAQSTLLDATKHANRCIQPPYPEILGNAPSPGGLSEDCLYLNVYTPAADDALRPVMVWIHGGAYIQGSANDFDAAALASENDVVVVCINYRLGIFGFLNLAACGSKYRESANLGILDQVSALTWVKESIVAFGGDPQNVTIFGESAGGGSVMALLATPVAAGLFHKAIAISPGPVNSPPDDSVSKLATHFGVDEVDALEKIEVMTGEELAELQLLSGLVFVAGVDGVVIPKPAHESVKGHQSVPMILGTTKDEGTLLAPFMDYQAALAVIPRDIVLNDQTGSYIEFIEGETPEQLTRLENVVFDMFRSNVLRVAQHSASPCWVYRFDLPTTINDGVLRATHGATAPFNFNAYGADIDMLCKFHDQDDARVRELSRIWSKMLARFARTGDPNGDQVPNWANYSANKRLSLIFDRDLSVSMDPDKSRRNWYGGCGSD